MSKLPPAVHNSFAQVFGIRHASETSSPQKNEDSEDYEGENLDQPCPPSMPFPEKSVEIEVR